MSLLRRAFVVASLAWAVAIPLAAWAASRPHASQTWYSLALGVYAIGSMVCHQLPVRSFHLAATPWPVCARCTGIYFGAAAAALAAVVSRLKSLRVAEPIRLKPEATYVLKPEATHVRLVFLVATLPTVITLAYEWTTGVMPGNWIRAAAGAPLGAAVAWVISKVD